MFRASCISAAEPSKNLPQPNQVSLIHTRVIWGPTADEKSISCENSLFISILHEETNAVLGMAGRVNTLHGDVTQLKGLAMARRLGDTLAVLASDNVELGSAKFSELTRISEIS